MTEAFEDGNYLVRVRAQVMMRDDSTGGWVPLGVGGLSDVSVRKRKIPCELEDSKHEYLIFGKRIADQTVVLSCTIKKDFEYNKVMPTFHHWKTGDKKFGLTFQTAADARAFDKGVRTAVQELLEGFCHSSSLLKYNKDVGDDEVFMTLNLPVERGDSRSSSDSSTRGGGSLSGIGVMVVGSGVNAGSGGRILTPPTTTNEQQPPPPPHHPHRMPYMPRRSDKPLGSDRDTSPSETINKKPPPPISLMMDKDVHADSYVQLTAVHDYMYPMVDEGSLKSHHHHHHHRRDSTGSLKKRSFESSSTLTTTTTTTTTTLPTPSSIMKHHHHHHPRRNHRSTGSSQTIMMSTPAMMASGGGHQRLRCRHCQEWYIENENRKGACEYAPDCMRTGMNRIACISCAECMLYHCMADAEGEFGHHPCECTCTSSSGNDDPGCTRRWLGLALLSLLVPCLWCYPPLRACHWCGVACGICGGRHSAASSSS